jgi:hypothetical protein
MPVLAKPQQNTFLTVFSRTPGQKLTASSRPQTYKRVRKQGHLLKEAHDMTQLLNNILETAGNTLVVKFNKLGPDHVEIKLRKDGSIDTSFYIERGRIARSQQAHKMSGTGFQSGSNSMTSIWKSIAAYFTGRRSYNRKIAS